MSASTTASLSSIHKDMVQLPGYGNNQVDIHSSDSILIYLSVSGSYVPIRVLESDSIASVKLRIQTCKGFVVKKQKLVFGGRELARNDSLVKDYGVCPGDVLHLVLKLSDLLAIIVSTNCGKDFEFHVDRYRNIAYLKQKIFKEGKGFVNLTEQELFCKGEKLDDQKLIDDISKKSDGAIHLVVKKTAKVRATPLEKDVELSVEASNNQKKREEKQNQNTKTNNNIFKKPPDKNFWLEPIIVNPRINIPLETWDLINATIEGLNKGNQPVRSSEGTGGTYFMRDSSGQKVVAVFKPTDEEPMARNNPQGLPISKNGEGLKKGTKVGEGALREVTAYILDHPKNGTRDMTHEVMGFSGVPPTVLIWCLHKGFHYPKGFECSSKNVKIGSLQMFKENDGSCEDIGPQSFPVQEVHKICILDIRLANADRHSGNVLIHKNVEDGRVELIPIDHGYCLPNSFEDCTFDWLYWPQASQPFSSESIEYIEKLDAEQDLALLKFHGWDVPIECARILQISTMLLKKGTERGLSPFAIGNIMCRETLNKESVIEEIVRQAWESLLPNAHEEDFLKQVSHVMDIRLDALKK